MEPVKAAGWRVQAQVNMAEIVLNMGDAEDSDFERIN
jgi:hypothetical protein